MNEFLFYWSGTTRTSRQYLAFRVCGEGENQIVNSTVSAAIVNFQSNRAVKRRGFHIHVQTISKPGQFLAVYLVGLHPDDPIDPLHDI